MAYQGQFRAGGAQFHNQRQSQLFAEALKGTQGGLGIRPGMYLSGPEGAQFKTVAGVNPNVAGWGNLIEPGYELAGYMGPAQQLNPRAAALARANGQTPEGIAILQKIAAPPAAAPAPVAAAPAPSPDRFIESPGVYTPPQPQGPTMEDIASAMAAQVEGMQAQFAQVLQEQTKLFQEQQQAQSQRMEALQQAMLQSQAQMRERPTVTGVKTASGTSGDQMQIAKRGVSGAFGRRGMRIKSLNVG